MYLNNEYQGKGYGKAMIERALEKAIELDYSKIILETNKKLVKAINLYKKYGFNAFEAEHLSDRCDIAMIKILKD